MVLVDETVPDRGGIPLAKVKRTRKSIARLKVTRSSKSTKIQTVITPDRK